MESNRFRAEHLLQIALGFALSCVFSRGAIAETACTQGPPPCPGNGYEASRICRSACEGGGYRYRFGGGCGQDWEDVAGVCQPYPDAQGNHFREGRSFELHWSCPQSGSAASGGLPARRRVRVFTVRTAQTDARYPDAGEDFDMRLVSPELDEMLSRAAAGSVDYFQCFREMTYWAGGNVKGNCEQDNDESGPSGVQLNCSYYSDRISTAIRARVAELGAAAQARGLRAPFLPMDSYDVRGRQELAAGIGTMLATSQCVVPRPGSENEIVFLSREFITESLPEVLGRSRVQSSPRCQHKILRAYLERLADVQIGDPPCAPGSTETRCQEVRESTRRTLAALRTVFDDPNLWIEGLLSDQVLQCVAASSDPARALRSLAQDFSLASACVNLSPGESQVASTDGLINDTVNARYSLSLSVGPDGRRTYTAGLNLAFNPPEQQEAMTARANECLRTTNPMLGGPAGERLQIALMTPPANPAESPGESEDVPPPVSVRIDSAIERAYATGWAPDIDCETMTHEMLHLLGLVDEYHEHWIGYNMDKSGRIEFVGLESGSGTQVSLPANDCRSIGPEISVMRDQAAAFAAVREGRRSSLLFPAHFNAITRPGCTAANSLYYQCAADAYTSSRAHFGDRGCTNGRPAACSRDDGAWLGEVVPPPPPQARGEEGS